jgi:hypothetical protein
MSAPPRGFAGGRRRGRAESTAEKLREEVASVRQLQESVIPKRLPAVKGYALSARYEPSQIRVIEDRPVAMAGGDYYNAFRLSPDQPGLSSPHHERASLRASSASRRSSSARAYSCFSSSCCACCS